MLGCCHSEVIVSRTRRVLALGGMLFVVSRALAQQEATQKSEGGRQTEASTRAKSEEVRELQHVTTISDSGDFRTKYAELQLGSLEAGKKYRLHLKALNPSEVEAKPLAPHIELWIDGRQAAVEAKPVGKSGIFRLSIKVKGPLELESNGTVPAKWLLRLNGAERVIETHGFLF